ncbi:hypothetical protein BX616_003410 [Lobosporangium transversale]|uniref:Uncharacterized protein n=1 Tax=Lobosporangium transversale TaxID=64571 RepID=A0A1Y2GKT4_9FUNG|nr:hypothetical protein BCR41DRAFT_355036 [Lobosporangium transversale]KAF9898963.1 hypothetical protein BX616_003410 [Lobosporangium transversale]ORZ13822.1 hypothetical protein BCR41DRAFT_355036 [Lobosporangium transversale]|eukprot:XP_021880606.1 hypothetical protein BCR41DRAFT_355036 [Lobosporangium transversale]
MSTAQVVAPSPMVDSATNSRGGLSSIRTIFTSTSLKRHSIAQISSPNFRVAVPVSNSGTARNDISTSRAPSSSLSSSSSSLLLSSSSVVSLFPTASSRRRSSMSKAAERDWKEQAKQIFPLSTVNETGMFLPPTPLEKSLNDDLKDTNEDYFDTIINTPPEKVKALLSTESTISPGMFSLPSSSSRKNNRAKRHTMPSLFSTPSLSPPSPLQQQQSSSISDFASAASTQQTSRTRSESQPYQVQRTSNINNSHYSNNNSNSNSNNYSSTKAESNASRNGPTTIVSDNGSNINNSNITAPSSFANVLVTPPSSPPALHSTKETYFTPSPSDTIQSQPQPQSQVKPDHPRSSSIPSPSSPMSPSLTEEDPASVITKPVSSIEHANSIRSRSRAQIKFLTGAKDPEEDLSELLVDPFEALLSLSSSSPSTTTADDAEMSSPISNVSSPAASPRRQSLALQKEKEQIWKLNAQKLRSQNNFEDGFLFGH